MLNGSVTGTSKMLLSLSQYLVKFLKKSALVVIPILLGIFTPYLIAGFENMP